MCVCIGELSSYAYTIPCIHIIRTGGFTETSPYVGISDNGLGDMSGPVGWDTFQPMAIMWLYKYYGNVQIIEEAYNYTKVSRGVV